jgi:large subunit ribosomal protein L18
MADKITIKTKRAVRRRRRVRGKVSGTADIPRLTVAKSLKNTFIQIIDDVQGQTLVGAATNSKAMADRFDSKDNKVEQAKKLGQAIAELAQEKGISQVVFDRNHYRFHGRIKAVADGAREKGLKF